MGKAGYATWVADFFVLGVLIAIFSIAGEQPPLYITLGGMGIFNTFYYIGAYLYYNKKM
jgi:hypothetical protein